MSQQDEAAFFVRSFGCALFMQGMILMQCTKCGTIGYGQFCTNCGTPLIPVESTPKKAALLGFRSNQSWKKAISIIYIIFCFFLTLGCLLSISKIDGQVTLYDHILNSFINLIYLFTFYSPLIFLSNTKFRDKLPLFKKHISGYSGIGIIIVIILLLSTASILSSLHSPEYLADMENHAYTQVENIPASCENDGYVLYHCDYCEDESKEVFPATGHNYVQVKEVQATCQTDGYKTFHCSYCKAEKKDTVPSSGHNMIETFREEATETTGGKIVMTCTVCGVENTSVINKLPLETETTSVPTEKELYIAACQTVTYKELAREPDKYKDKKLCLKGKVMQVSEPILGSEVTYLIQVTQSEYGYWSDNVYVTYKLPKGAPKILEDDIVMLYGECEGDHSYFSVLGAYITVPRIDAEYIDILELE